jgi:uncharacterized protein (TIGR02594 family)
MRSFLVALALLVLSVGYADAGPFNSLDDVSETTVRPHIRAKHVSHRHQATKRPSIQYASHHQRRRGPVATIAEGVGGAVRAGGSLLAAAERYIGTNPTGRKSRWCGHFMNFALQKSGHRSSAGNTALEFASYGRRSGPQVGAIAVMRRKSGGHVGVVKAVGPDYVVLISGNSRGRKVAVGRYPKSRIIAYRMPA